MFGGAVLVLLWPWIAVITTVILSLYIIGTWNYDTFRRRKMKYLPPKFPFAGNIINVFTGEHTYPGMILDLYKRSEGWAYCGLFEFTRPFIMLRDPELIKSIAVKHFDSFTSHRSLVTEDLDPSIAKNLFVLKGDKWKRMRQATTPVFTASKLKTQFFLLRECAQYTTSFLERIYAEHSASHSGPGDKPLEISTREIYKKYAISVAVSMSYGQTVNFYEDDNNEFFWALNSYSVLSADNSIFLGAYMLWPELMQALRISFLSKEVHDFFHETAETAISHRKMEDTARPDVVQLMAQLKNFQKEHNFDDKDVTSIASLFFIAGVESVSSMLYFICYQMAINPDKQQMLCDEIDRFIPDGNTELSYEAIQKMEYMDMVIQETLRIHPTLLTIDRVCEKACSIPLSPDEPPLTVNEGEVITIPIYALHMNPEFFPEPEKFKPERFSEENIGNINPYAYMPFGAGPRKCIGQRFANLEMKVILANVFARFNFCPVATTPVPMVVKKRAFTLIPETGYGLGLIPRKK